MVSIKILHLQLAYELAGNYLHHTFRNVQKSRTILFVRYAALLLVRSLLSSVLFSRTALVGLSRRHLSAATTEGLVPLFVRKRTIQALFLVFYGRVFWLLLAIQDNQSSLFA
ncbi:hypothetical protein D3C86_1463570 [compost metagenome]